MFFLWKQVRGIFNWSLIFLKIKTIFLSGFGKGFTLECSLRVGGDELPSLSGLYLNLNKTKAAQLSREFLTVLGIN